MRYTSLDSLNHIIVCFSCYRFLFRSSLGHRLLVRNRWEIMVLLTKRELRHLVHPHYFINMILSFSFVVLRVIEPFCSYAFSSCEMDHRETEIIFFAVVITIFKTRKQGAVNALPYVSTACMFSKLANVILYFYSDPLYGVIYLVACLVHLVLLPEPSYSGPENILFIPGKDLEEELSADKRLVWLIEMYAAWNPACADFAPQFSELSAKYSLDNLKFAKVDLARSPETAEKYQINISSFSKQLPTLILFKGGKEEIRRPLVASNGKLIQFSFTFENVVNTFDLNNLYQECKKNPIPKKDKKVKKQE